MASAYYNRYKYSVSDIIQKLSRMSLSENDTIAKPRLRSQLEWLLTGWYFNKRTKFAYRETRKKGQVNFSRVEVEVDRDFVCGGNANFMTDSLASLGRARSLGHKNSPVGWKYSRGRGIRLDASLNETCDGAWLHMLESLRKMDSVVVKALYTVSIVCIV